MIGAALLVVALGGLGLWATRSGPRAPRPAAGPDQVGRDSQRFLPPELAAVYLGMSPTQLTLARPKSVRNQRADEGSYLVYDEGLSQASRVLYSFGSARLALEKVQIASELANVQQIAPRIAAHAQRLGTPSGVWDCPADVKRLPTRRFSWTRGHVGAMDVYLLLGARVSATLYVAPSGVIRDSLANARCTPTPPERLKAFPIPAPDALATKPGEAP
jgi:hypothetical protein